MSRHKMNRTFGAVGVIGAGVLLAGVLATPSRAKDAPGEGAKPAATPPERRSLLDGALPASAHANKILNLILAAAEYKGPTILFLASSSQEVQNACATFILPDSFTPATMPPGIPAPPVGIPAILYNPTFMTQMSFSTDNEYVSVYILAHELGHIVCGHVDPSKPLSNNRHPWDKELEADRFAGRILAKLGAKRTELQMAHRVMVATQWIMVQHVNGKPTVIFADRTVRVNDLITGSTTHPDAIKRIQAIAQGWKEGGGEGDVADELGAIFVDMVRQLVRWEPGM